MADDIGEIRELLRLVCPSGEIEAAYEFQGRAGLSCQGNVREVHRVEDRRVVHICILADMDSEDVEKGIFTYEIIGDADMGSPRLRQFAWGVVRLKEARFESGSWYGIRSFQRRPEGIIENSRNMQDFSSRESRAGALRYLKEDLEFLAEARRVRVDHDLVPFPSL